MTLRKSAFVSASGLLLAVLLFLAACTDARLDALNTPEDEIVASEVDANLLGQAFAHSQYHGMRGQYGSGGYQIGQNLYGDLYSQYFATTAANFDSDQFIEVGQWSHLAWLYFYETPAPQLDFVEDFTAEEGMDLENAIAKIWKVQIYHRMTDYWGPIIYSEFGSGETSVPYDSQEDIYMDFFQKLDEAIAVLEQNAGGTAFGEHDLIYGGNVDQWRTFANSLRLRLAMRVKYTEPGLAQQEAEKAVAAGVMMDGSDSAMLETNENSQNPLNTITAWGEFRMSGTMESVLEGYEDPRLPDYFNPAVNGDSDEDGSPYEGFRNGLPRSAKGPDLNDANSQMDTKWIPMRDGGTNPPMQVMRASEVYFLRAEGALEDWNMGGTAEELYNEGIRTSLRSRVDASEEEIEAYISSTNTPVAIGDEFSSPPVSDLPVAFEAGADTERQLEQIITQKWLAIYPDGIEGWAEKRRTGYPTLYPIIESGHPDIPEDGVMRRLTFTSGEYQNNATAVEAATDLLNGPDANTTRLWWDAK